MIFDDVYFMKQAIAEARKAADKGEVPVGAIVVCKNRIIARTYNLTETLTDVTAHAEVQAITAAASFIGGKYLNDCTMFVTLEPCVMCAGALKWAQLGRLVYGASDKNKGFTAIKENLLHPKTVVISSVLEDDCSEILTAFFKTKR